MSPTRSTQPPGRLRRWFGPLTALGLALALLLLPRSFKAAVAGGLESTVFFPFRLAVGWGARTQGGQQEARRLARELSRVRLNEDERVDVLGENARLRRLLGFQRRAGYALSPCTVVGRERGRFGELLVVEPANLAEAEPGRAVLTPGGLIGRVSSRQGRFARVECLSHFQMAVSVINQRSREGGILKWSPEHSPELAIRGIPAQSDWRAGDRLITSGLGTAFPRGLLVGWVIGQRSQRGGLLMEVRVRPAASAARSEEVFLLVRQDAPAPIAEPGMSAQDLSSLYPVEPGARLAGMLQKQLVTLNPGPSPVP